MKITKKQKVLEYLLSGKSITPEEARKMFGAYRLADIIFDLKDDYNIVATREDIIDRDGNKSHFARYTLLGKRDLESEAKKMMEGLN